MFYQIFFSPQVTQSVIIKHKEGICESPQELPNDLKLRIFDPMAFSPMGGAFVPTQEKKTIRKYDKNPQIP